MLGFFLIVVLILALVLLGPRLVEQYQSEGARGDLAVYGPSLTLVLLIVVVATLWALGVV
jgi:hypothetical protein